MYLLQASGGVAQERCNGVVCSFRSNATNVLCQYAKQVVLSGELARSMAGRVRFVYLSIVPSRRQRFAIQIIEVLGPGNRSTAQRCCPLEV